MNFVNIPNGLSSVTFYYGDTTAGSPLITGAFAGLTSATQTVTVTVGLAATPSASRAGPNQIATDSAATATRFAITSYAVSGPSSATASLGPITVRLLDELGRPVAAAAGGLRVNLSSTSAGPAVFAATVNGATLTFVTIPAGQSEVTLFYGDTVVGSPVVTASFGALTSATQPWTITVP